MPIDAGKYDRSIALLCPTCGGSQFAHDDSDDSATALVTCANCGLEIPKEGLNNDA
ncbi:ECs_2282 family putative zinc-binding protein [Xanthomonas vasicola]|uniref:ECs_2282 family putative zinc-binding protein n=2 Tax=Xanthomonas vasicola TaxID=56459 RepID=UPI00269AE70F